MDSPGPGSCLSADGHIPPLAPRPAPSLSRSAVAVSRIPPTKRAANPSHSGGHPSRDRCGLQGRQRVRPLDAPMPNGLPQRPQTRRPERLRSAFTAQLPQSGQAIPASLSQPRHHRSSLAESAANQQEPAARPQNEAPWGPWIGTRGPGIAPRIRPGRATPWRQYTCTIIEACSSWCRSIHLWALPVVSGRLPLSMRPALPARGRPAPEWPSRACPGESP
jgi:hypothetical protein